MPNRRLDRIFVPRVTGGDLKGESLLRRGKIILLIAPLLWVQPLWAQSFHWDSTVLGQGRENRNNQNELPLNGYLGMGGASPNKTLSFETNMRFFRDFERSLDDLDLYQANLMMKPSEIVKISFGRQFVSEGFAAEIIDGAHMRIHPNDFWLSAALYSGVFRSDEIGDFNTNDGLFSGLTLGLENIPHFRLNLQGAWRKNNITLVNLRENDEILAGGSLSYDWSGQSPGLIYGLAEYDTTAKIMNTGSLGIDWTLSKRLSLNLEGNYFNINRQTNRNTILSLFTRGATFGGRAGSTITLLPKRVDWVQSYSYQRIEIQQNVFRNGHIVDTSFIFSVPQANLTVEPGYSFSKSFGGRVHGGKLFLHEDFTKKLNADVGIDFVSYRKITNDNDIGFSTVAWGGYQFLKGWTLSGGVEYNKNNVFNEDIRGSFKLEFHYDYQKT